MPTDVIMPALGVAQERGTLLNWRKIEGQSVIKGEPLMEIETDKATVEIEAPASGILANVTASPGDDVPVGNRIAVILAPGEVATQGAIQDPHPSPLPKGEGKSQSRPLPQRKGTGEGRPAISTPTPPAEPAAQTRHVGKRILASPAAKRIAREKGIDLVTLKGSGPDEAVLAKDVLRSTTSKAVVPGGSAKIKETVQLTPMRRIVGQRMTQSKQNAPHFYVSVDIDMTVVSKIRAQSKDQGEPCIPSINDFILQACARALKDFPSLNSTFTEQGITLHADINIGTAVALEDGLVVPVIRNADRLSLADLARETRKLINKAQNKRLFPFDYEGGTFTVSNLGMVGAESFTAIINPPQCAILAVGRVAPRVVADGETVAIRSLMTATLSADHRIVDGAIAARFLSEIKTLLENLKE